MKMFYEIPVGNLSSEELLDMACVRELIEIEHISVFQGKAPALPGIAAVERPRAGRGGQGKRCQENITAAVFEIFGFQQGGHRLRSFPVMSRKISSSVFPSSISCRRSSSP